ncbi:MAG: hypothetical protein HY899_04310 [Deltaproteobacteria bacterium]|nr:hypothetical protein [Deltaproteobacteria bacterium]
MSLLRLVRIGAICTGITWLFRLSHEAGVARGNEEVPGLLAAIGVVSLLFFIRALLAEFQGPASDLQKDLLWGLTAGGVLTILIRL